MSNIAPLNCLANEWPVNCQTPLTVPIDEPINRSRNQPRGLFTESCFNPRTCQSMTSLLMMDIWRHLRGTKRPNHGRRRKKKKISYYQWLLIGPSCSPLFLYLCRRKKKNNNVTGRNITRLIGPVPSLLPPAFPCSTNFWSISIMVLRCCQNSSPGACSSPSLFCLVPGQLPGID